MLDILTIMKNRPFSPLLDEEQLDFIENVSENSRGYSKNKQALGVLLKFYEKEGRAPLNADLIPLEILVSVSQQLTKPVQSLENFDWESRTAERFRKEIRLFYGYRPSQLKDIENLKEWLSRQIVKEGLSFSQSKEAAYAYLKFHKLEPFKPKSMERHIRSVYHDLETLYFSSISDKLSSSCKEKLDSLIAVEGLLGASDTKEVSEEGITFTHLKEDAKGVSKKSILREIQKLKTFRQVDLPDQFGFSEKFIEKYSQRIFSEYPSDIKLHPDSIRWSGLSSFCYIQSRKTTDNLVDQLRKRIRILRTQAENHASLFSIKEVKREGGKLAILYHMASSILESPDGIIREVIFPHVSQEKLENIVQEFHQGQWYKYQVKLKMQSLYKHHARSLVLPILNTLDFKSNNPSRDLLLQAIEVIKKNQDSKSPYFPSSEPVPINGIIPSQWISLVLEEPRCGSGSTLVNRCFYEIAVLETLSSHLNNKEVWVEGAKQYRNPDEDTPADFYENQALYFESLGLTMDSKKFIANLKKELSKNLKALNANIPSNSQVKLIKRQGKGPICITPFSAKKEPDNLSFLQKEIQDRWGGVTLLDLLRETDLRVQFSRQFLTIGDHTKMNPSVLQKRLLLCLGALGSNIGIQRVFSANGEVDDSDLKYVKRRYITPQNLRSAIVDIINATLETRDPKIWGTATTGCSCDSTHVNAWNQNLVSQWHHRYKKSGVMIYWHVDQNSLCVYSQLKTCTSSEVASMIEGVLRHSSQMDMDKTYTDTHGQSTVGFAFSYLLGFYLLPRIKRMHKQKLCVPNRKSLSLYPNLELILHSTPISWKRIGDQYTEMVKYTAALKKGTTDTDVLLRRFSKNNYNHPTYQALMELGKVIKTIFLCRYLMSESLRQEINEALNIVERVNGSMTFLFYGKLGAISSNRIEEQEITILSLHLLQTCLVYINTLIIQEILKEPEWRTKLTENDWRALTPLIHSHINPYGRFELDMNKRLPIPYPHQRRAAQWK